MRTLLKRSFSSYYKAYEDSLNPNLEFWKTSAHQVKWTEFPKTMLTVENEHFFRWFPDGKLNITDHCLDKNVA